MLNPIARLQQLDAEHKLPPEARRVICAAVVEVERILLAEPPADPDDEPGLPLLVPALHQESCPC